MSLPRWRRLAYAATLGFTAIYSGVAHSEVTAQLDYVAAPGCPAAADFESVVAGRLGYSPFRSDASDRLAVRIETSGRGLEGRLDWQNGAGDKVGERTFPSRSGDCGELVRAMGFAVALQVQLMATMVAQEPAPPPKPPAPVPAPPTVSATPAPLPANQPDEIPSSGSGPLLAAGAGASAGVGLSPNAVGLGRLFGTIAWSRVALEVAAEMSLPSELRLPDGSGFTQQVRLAGLAGCGLRSRWSACVLAKAGEIHVVGQGVTFPATSSGFLVEAGVRLAVTQPLSRHVQISARADGLALLTRGVVTLDSMPVWTTPRVAAILGVDLGVRFH